LETAWNSTAFTAVKRKTSVTEVPVEENAEPEGKEKGRPPVLARNFSS
jgi:hypothetical protein